MESLPLLIATASFKWGDVVTKTRVLGKLSLNILRALIRFFLWSFIIDHGHGIVHIFQQKSLDPIINVINCKF